MSTNLDKLKDIHLSKWPAIVVVGDKITAEQAAEIIIRTDGLHFSSNDKQWCKQLFGELGINTNEWGGVDDDWKNYDKVRKELGCLDLEYLNTERIASCSIGGSHGWMQWDGTIQYHQWNIGKWPNTLNILQEWSRIAEAFPFLRLTSQLFNDEWTEKDIKPTIEYEIRYGKAVWRLPTNTLVVKSTKLRDFKSEFTNLLSPGGERGCTLNYFKWALEITRNRLKDHTSSRRY